MVGINVIAGGGGGSVDRVEDDVAGGLVAVKASCENKGKLRGWVSMVKEWVNMVEGLDIFLCVIGSVFEGV